MYSAKSNRTVFSRSLALLCLSALIAAAAGCGDSAGPDPEPPSARVIFLNEIAALPSLQVYANGDGPTATEFGQLTDAVELPTGATRFALTAPGSTEALIDETLTLSDQLYLLAFTGEVTQGNLALWAVDQAPPELTSGQAAMEVVNLYDGDLAFDVYLNDEPLAMAIGRKEVSAFTVTSPTSAGTLQVFNTGDDPENALPVSTAQVSLDEGQALMVLMKNAATGNGIVLDTLVVR